MRRTFSFIIFCFFVQLSLAQVTGYRGNRMALKANVVNGIRPISIGIDAEYAIGRQKSITLGFLGNQYQPADLTTFSGTILPEFTRSGLLCLEYRLYGNKILPAPQGIYLSVAGGIGLEQHEFTILGVRKHVKRTVFGHFSIPSLGYQTTIGKRFLLDFKYATETLLVAQDEFHEYKLSLIHI